MNFRWYLANSVFRNVEKNGGEEDRTVFLSLHADSLHRRLSYPASGNENLG